MRRYNNPLFLGKLVFLCAFFLVFSVQVFAQQGRQLKSTDLYKIYKAQGKSDEEIRTLLREAQLQLPPGFVPPILTQTEIDSLQAEYFMLQMEVLTKFSEVEAAEDTLTRDELIEQLQTQLDSLEAIKPWGYDFFDVDPKMLMVPTSGIVTDDYLLGPQDEIIVTLWGETDVQYKLTLDRDGSVYIDKVGPVYIGNQNLHEAEIFLREKLSKIYSGIKTNKVLLKITPGRTRNIRVYVTGEVNINGPKLLSALSDPIDALNWAGGPTERGSLRNIKIIRNRKKIDELDLYDFWLNEDFTKIRLQDNDNIQVPLVSKVVQVVGEVRRQAKYEMKENESLSDALRFAGGFTANAWRGKIQVERFIQPEMAALYPGDKIIIDVIPSETPFDSFNLLDGDIITVLPLKEIKKNYVEIFGSVTRTGTFMYFSGMTLGDLIEKAEGILPVAFPERGHIVRTNPDLTKEIIQFSFNNENIGVNWKSIELQNLDQIRVFSQKELRTSEYVTVLGKVRIPGRQEYLENITVISAILRAGGFLESAEKHQVELSRIVFGELGDSLGVEEFTIELSGDYALNQGEFRLTEYDQIFVRENPGWELQRNVKIMGEVVNFGEYTLLSEVEKIIDLIGRAGGLKENAYPGGIYFYRKKNETGRIDIDLPEAFDNPKSVNNITLVEGDSIYIPELENIVTVRGMVNLPASVLYNQGKGIDYYIEGAGGFAEYADKGRVQVQLANGKVIKRRRFWPDRKITPGSTIIVPRKEQVEGINWGQAISTTTQIVSSLVTTIYILNNIK